MSIRLVRLVRFTLSLASDCLDRSGDLLLFLAYAAIAIAVFGGIGTLCGWCLAYAIPLVNKGGAPFGWPDRMAAGMMYLFFCLLLSVAIHGCFTFVSYLRLKWAALSSS